MAHAKREHKNGFETIRGLERLLEPQVRTEIDDFFKSTVRLDYERMLKKTSLATTSRVRELHLMHTVYGHACAGHGEFYEKAGAKNIPVRYANITMDDVMKEIPGQDPMEIKRDRQQLIDHISEWLKDRVETLLNPGKQPEHEDLKLIKVYKKEGVPLQIEPLAGAKMFEHAVLKNFESVLIGFYMGSCMDSAEWREKVEAKFGVGMHKGTIIPVDLFALKRSGLILEDFQNSNYVNKLPGFKNLETTEIIPELKRIGIIPKEKVQNGNGYASAFLELSKGAGISDDAAFITASLMFGTEAGFGLLLADAIDTLDKYVPMINMNGQDEILGKTLKNKYKNRLKKDLPVTDDQILDFIYISRIDEKDRKTFPSCSQRRFWEMDTYGMNAVESHMAFLNHLKSNSKYPPQKRIGFKGVPNNKFYESYTNKLEEAMTNKEHPIVLDKYMRGKLKKLYT